MQESHRKDLASHPDPESCGNAGNGVDEALTGAHAGQPSSCETTYPRTPTLLTEAEGNTRTSDMASSSAGPAQS
jgi:RNA-directed DNA polymerase